MRKALLFIGLFCLTAVAKADISSNLVSHFKLDEGAGTLANDSGSLASSGTVVNTPSWDTGRIGAYCLTVSSPSKQYVALSTNVAAQLASGNEVTLAGWFKGTTFQSLIRIQTNFSDFIILGYSTSTPQAIISTDGGASGVNISTVIYDGNWHHIAMTWKTNTTSGFKVYIDGFVSAQRDSAAVSLPSFFPFDFNPAICRYGNDGEYLTGSVDDLRIYSRELSAADIASLYSNRNRGTLIE